MMLEKLVKWHKFRTEHCDFAEKKVDAWFLTRKIGELTVCTYFNFSKRTGTSTRRPRSSGNCSEAVGTAAETEAENAKKWSSSSGYVSRDRPGGSRPPSNHDNIALDDLGENLQILGNTVLSELVFLKMAQLFTWKSLFSQFFLAKKSDVVQKSVFRSNHLLLRLFVLKFQTF